MPKNTPMVITLYDSETNDVKNTFSRSFVPWKILKKAVKLSKDVDFDDMKPEDVDQIAGLVVEVFGDKFTVDDLNEGADAGEMISVLQNIIARAKGISLNPTPPAS